MEKIKQKLIRATVSMPIAPVMVIQSVVNVQVLICSVGGGLQIGMYSAQGVVCHASKMDEKSGKERFACKCAHVLGVATMFRTVYNYFFIAILEYGREYTYDKNTKLKIFARVLTAVSATPMIYHDLA
jgi:ribose 5-phosphate isomerase RpiB